MAKLILRKIEEFLNAMKAVNNITDEAVIELSEEGLKVRSLDPSNIAMINVFIPKDFFDEYEAGENIGLNFEDFVKILQRMKKDDILTLTTEDSKFIIESENNKTKKKYVLPILDISKEVPPKPNIEFDCMFKILSKDLKEIFKDILLVTSYVKIITSSEKVIFLGSGDKGDVEIIVPSEELIDLKCEEEQRANYNLEYLNSFVKTSSNDATVKIEYSTDKPISVTFYYDDIEVNYLLAPRAED